MAHFDINYCLVYYRSYVRIVKSYCPGMGKSLYIKRMGEKLKDKTKRDNFLLSIPVPGPAIEVERILETLCETSYTKIIHFDIAPSVNNYYYYLNLLIYFV